MRIVTSLLLLGLFACGGESKSGGGAKEAPADEGGGDAKSRKGGKAGKAGKAGKSGDDEPAAHRTQHTQQEGKSINFTLLVGVTPDAVKKLKSSHQTIEVSLVVHDNVGGDDGGFRENRQELPAEGGILEFPAMDLSPVKGRPLTDFSVNAYSKRSGNQPNVLQCEYLGGTVSEMAGRMNIECKAL